MEDMLPESDQALALELVKKQAIAWDPDYTKVTPQEKAQIDQAAAELASGDYVPENAIDWD